MKAKKLNRKSSCSIATSHTFKQSPDIQTFDYLQPSDPITSKHTTTHSLTRLTPISPHKDSLPFLIASATIKKLPKDLKSLDEFTSSSKRSPSDRKDAKQLLIWLDRMLTKTLNEQNEPEEIFESTLKIYDFCLAEVVKQVSTTCKERGVLIEKVWKAYKTLFEKALKIQNAKICLIEDRNDNDKFRIHKLYNNQMKELENELKTTKELTGSLEDQLKIKENSCIGGEEREKNYQKRLEMLQYRYKKVKKENLFLKEEMRVLKAQFPENYDKKLLEASLAKLRHKLKIKSQGIIEEELENDPMLANISLIIANDQKNLLEQIKKYGIFYIEMLQNEKFTQEDFKDMSTQTINVSNSSMEIQTITEDLCGDSIGVKKRKVKISDKVTFSTLHRLIPQYNPNNRRNSNIEDFIGRASISPNSSMVDNKRQHTKIKNFLINSKDVRNH